MEPGGAGPVDSKPVLCWVASCVWGFSSAMAWERWIWLHKGGWVLSSQMSTPLPPVLTPWHIRLTQHFQGSGHVASLQIWVGQSDLMMSKWQENEIVPGRGWSGFKKEIDVTVFTYKLFGDGSSEVEEGHWQSEDQETQSWFFLCLWWWMLTRLTVVIIVQYIPILSHYVVHLKLI